MTRAASHEEETVDIKRTWKTVLWEWVNTVAYAIVLAVIIRTYFLATFVVPTGSMEPTLHGAVNYGRGDRLIAIKFIYGFPIPFTKHRILSFAEPGRGDVIVFNSAGISRLDEGKDYIKRLVGLGGERLRIAPETMDRESAQGFRSVSGRVCINGEALEEPASIADRRYYWAGDYGRGEVVVPQDHFFMLGDNVSNSRDSRYWGFVPRENVIGRAVAIYWPPSRIGFIR